MSEDLSSAARPPSAFQAIWNDLHVISFYIDVYECNNPEAQQAFHDHVRALQYFLPCDSCRPHFSAFLKVNPFPQPGIYAEDAFPNARWVCALHNNVNGRQGKRLVPFEESKRFYADSGPPPECPTQGLALEDAAASSPPALPPSNVPLLIGGAIGIMLLILIAVVCAVTFPR